MDFDLSDEQRLLKDSAERFIRSEYPFEKRREWAASDSGFSRENWAKFAELGWLALPFAEEDGGFGGTAVETMILMEALGAGLAVEPYLATVVLAGRLVAAGGTAKERILPALTEGRAQLVFAGWEARGRHDPAWVETKAEKDGGGYAITGAKAVVLNAPAADHIVVTARTGGAADEPGGISLFAVARNAAGLEVRGYATIDGHRAGDVALDRVRVGTEDAIGEIGGAWPLIDDAVAHATAAACAEAVGVLQVLHDDTLEYLKTRHQFGRAIGSFQSLQHRMVDMFVELEQCRSMACMAALRADGADAALRRKSVAAAKAQIGTGGKFVGHQAIQLHGGIGMTDELRIGHYAKRLVALNTLFGDAEYHLARMAEQLD
jgi:alkylation response protein AidB-like acyl-CoA dehydrogenase